MYYKQVRIYKCVGCGCLCEAEKHWGDLLTSVDFPLYEDYRVKDAHVQRL